jgi:hypothetical protein
MPGMVPGSARFADAMLSERCGEDVMTLNQARMKAAANRYTMLAGCTPNSDARTTLLETAAEFSGETRQSDELAYLHRRYDEEMRAAATAKSRDAKIAHLEMALRYAVRARNSRQGEVWIGPMEQEAAQWAAA